MSSDKDFHDYVLYDLFQNIEGITSRAMFGGYGFYKDGKIFGMIANGILYFKVGAGNKADYENYGSKPFIYEGKNKPVTMSYWEVPEQIQEDQELLAEWIEKAVAENSKKK